MCYHREYSQQSVEKELFDSRPDRAGTQKRVAPKPAESKCGGPAMAWVWKFQDERWNSGKKFKLQ